MMFRFEEGSKCSDYLVSSWCVSFSFCAHSFCGCVIYKMLTVGQSIQAFMSILRAGR